MAQTVGLSKKAKIVDNSDLEKAIKVHEGTIAELTAANELLVAENAEKEKTIEELTKQIKAK